MENYPQALASSAPGRRTSLAEAATLLQLSSPSALYLLDGPTFPVGDGGSWLKALILASLARFGAGATAIAPQLGADDVSRYERIGLPVIWLDASDYYGEALTSVLPSGVPWVFTDSLETTVRTLGATKSANHAVLMMDDYAATRRRERIGEGGAPYSGAVQQIIDSSRLTIWRSSVDRAAYSVSADRSVVVDGFEHMDQVEVCSDGPVAMLANFNYPPNREAAERLVRLDWGTRRLKLIGRIDEDLVKVATRLGHSCTGLVPDPREELGGCSAGIDPVTQGSGLSTKLGYYISIGLPAIATRVAVRGMDPDMVSLLTVVEDAAHLPALTKKWDYQRMRTAAEQARCYAREHLDLSIQLSRLAELLA
jgi:hypothetical protein